MEEMGGGAEEGVTASVGRVVPTPSQEEEEDSHLCS